MTSPAAEFPVDDREYYPLHEEDDVPETDFHKVQTTDLYDGIRVWRPDWFVSGDICIYWEPGNTRDYAAPDLFVAEGKPDVPHPRVYHLWRDPRILVAIEIGSRSSLRADPGPKREVYDETIGVTEYIYANPPIDDLRLWRRGVAGLDPVARQANGRVRSEVLDLEFGNEGGFLRAYTPDGERLRTHVESEELLAVEMEQRQEAEARAREAEDRATAEQSRREALERQLAELQAQLAGRGDTTASDANAQT